MSGHSKWHNIQAKKGKADAARGKIFTKLGRELLIAVKEGGPEPSGNSKLKSVIAKCKAANMPNDTINNAIKKASSSNENYEEITYEGYGPSGVAVIVNASTDNKNVLATVYLKEDKALICLYNFSFKREKFRLKLDKRLLSFDISDALKIKFGKDSKRRINIDKTFSLGKRKGIILEISK